MRLTVRLPYLLISQLSFCEITYMFSATAGFSVPVLYIKENQCQYIFKPVLIKKFIQVTLGLHLSALMLLAWSWSLLDTSSYGGHLWRSWPVTKLLSTHNYLVFSLVFFLFSLRFYNHPFFYYHIWKDTFYIWFRGRTHARFVTRGNHTWFTL